MRDKLDVSTNATKDNKYKSLKTEKCIKSYQQLMQEFSKPYENSQRSDNKLFHRIKIQGNKNIKFMQMQSQVKKQKLAMNNDHSFTTLDKPRTVDGESLFGAPNYERISQYKSIASAGPENRSTIQYDNELVSQMQKQTEFEQKITSNRDKLGKYLVRMEEQIMKDEIRINTPGNNELNLQYELQYMEQRLKDIISNTHLNQLLSDDMYSTVANRIYQQIQMLNEKKLSDYKKQIFLLQQDKLRLLQNQEKLYQTYRKYQEFYQQEVEYRDNMFRKLPLLHQMMNEYGTMKDLTKEESRLKQEFEEQFQNIKKLKECTTDQIFGQKDYKTIQFEIQKLNEELKQEMYMLPDEYRTGFSHATVELGDIFKKMQIQLGFSQPFNVNNETLHLLNQDEGKYEHIVGGLTSKISDVQIETAKKIIERYRLGIKKVDFGQYANVAEEQKRERENKQIIVLSTENHQLKIDLTNTKESEEKLRKENNVLNIKHTRVNEKLRVLTVQHNELSTEHEITTHEFYQLENKNQHFELKYAEVKQSYKYITDKLETVIQKAKTYKSDRNSLLLQLQQITEQLKEVQLKTLTQSFEEKKKGDSNNLEVQDQKMGSKINSTLRSSHNELRISQKSLADSLSIKSEERQKINDEYEKVESRQTPDLQKIEEDLQKKEQERKEHIKKQELELKRIRDQDISQQQIEEQRKRERQQEEKEKKAQYELMKQEVESMKEQKLKQKQEERQIKLQLEQEKKLRLQKEQESQAKQVQVIKIFEKKEFVLKDSKGIQVPDPNMIKQAESLKILAKKEYFSRMIQTDDLLEEELFRQLREWKNSRALKIFSTRGASDYSILQGVQFKKTFVPNEVSPEIVLQQNQDIYTGNESSDISPKAIDYKQLFSTFYKVPSKKVNQQTSKSPPKQNRRI